MSFQTVLTKIAATCALAAAAAGAHAADYQFVLTGAYTASWQITSSPTPDEVSGDQGFVLYDVAGSFTGAVSGLTDLTFYAGAMGGGLAVYDYSSSSDLLVADGPQLYTGSEDAPVFRLGSFALTDYNGSGDTYTLTIAAVPEPATVALMLAGLGLVGAAAARRRAGSEEAATA